MTSITFNLYHAFAIAETCTRAFWEVFPWDEYDCNLLFAFSELKRLRYVLRDGVRPVPRPRRLMLDSGAYTVHYTGREIRLDDYIAFILSQEFQWDEIVGLDVVGNPEQTYANLSKMRDAGIVAIPVFHYTPDYRKQLHWLERYAQEWPKVGIAAHSLRRRKDKLHLFLGDCFRAVWPKQIHHFGESRPSTLFQFPFTSCDTSGYIQGLGVFGRFRQFGGKHIKGLTIEDTHMSFLGELKPSFKLQSQIRARWSTTYEDII